MTQANLFEPSLDAEQSQYFTPHWLADEMARIAWEFAEPLAYLTKPAMFVEPSCGGGSLIRAVVRAAEGRAFRMIGIELDARWVSHLEHDVTTGGLPDNIRIDRADFLAVAPAWSAWYPPPDIVIANPPYDDGQDTQHIKAIVDLAAPFVVLMRTVAFHSAERAGIWAGVDLRWVEPVSERIPFNGETGKIDVSIVAGFPVGAPPSGAMRESSPRFRIISQAGLKAERHAQAEKIAGHAAR